MRRRIGGDMRKFLRRDAIAWGAAIGVLGVPVAYIVLRSIGVVLSNPWLAACVILPSVVLLVLAAVTRRHAWMLQAAAAAAIASVLLVAIVLGGVSLLAGALSDP